jgi:ABC-type cobalamin transport system ATPase subunit
MIGMIGPDGAGKSTLLGLIAGALLVRRSIGFVSQSYDLWEGRHLSGPFVDLSVQVILRS